VKSLFRSLLIIAALLLPTMASAANLISMASGNIDSSGTWSTIDATSFLNSESGSTVLNAINGTSSAFTPGAITIKGLAVKLSVLTNSAGTAKIELVQGGSSVSGTAVTVNCADLVSASAASDEGGWIVTSFANVTLAGATAYNVKVTTASSCNLTLWTDGTASNWSRMLVTTTAAAPSAGDAFYVFGNLTGAGTHTAYTVTVETTANTNYGNVANTLVSPSISVGQYGTLAFATASATNYAMEFAGPIVVYNGGTFSVGTSGTPVPMSSSCTQSSPCATLTMNTTTEGDTGITVRNGGAFNTNGAPRSAGKNVIQTHLGANLSSGSVPGNSMPVTDPTGWQLGDVVAVAMTSYKPTGVSETEKVTLSGNATSGALPVAGTTVAYGHLGQVVAYTSTDNGQSYSFPEQAEIILLTQNVRITGASNSKPGYIYCAPLANCQMAWTEFQYISGNAAGQYGIESETIPGGTFSLTYSSIHDTLHATLYIGTRANWGGTPGSPLKIQNVVMYNYAQTFGGSVSGYDGILEAVNSTNPNVILDYITLLAGNGWSAIGKRNYAGQFTNIVMADSGNNSGLGGSYGGSALTALSLPGAGNLILNNWGPLYFHSNYNFDVNWQPNYVFGTIKGIYVYHSYAWFSTATGGKITIDPYYGLGNNNVFQGGSKGSNDWVYKNGFLAADAANSNMGFGIDEAFNNIVFDNVEFCPKPTANSVFVACFRGDFDPVHDVGNTASNNTVIKVIGRNSPFLSTHDAVLQGQNFISDDSFISTDWGANHKTWLKFGRIELDTVITHNGNYSTRLTPYIVVFTGYIAGTTLTVNAGYYPQSPGCQISANMPIFSGASIAPYTLITDVGTGTCDAQNGTYTVNQSQTSGSSGSPITITGPLGRLPSAAFYQGVKVAVPAGKTATVCVYVRESSSGDASGVSYNGDAPRLINRSNPTMGINSDAVLATLAGSVGNWVQMCGTTPAAPYDGEFEFVVDSDQTVASNAGGWINETDWSATVQ
jgi:hypothetical protein